METALISVADLPPETWLNILLEGLRTQKNIYDIKQFVNTFELIDKHLNMVKNTYFAKFKPIVHTPLLNHLYENTQDISKNEIARALGLDGYRQRTDICTQGYIYLGRQLMDTISNKEMGEPNKLEKIKDLIENQNADVNYSEWVLSKNKKGDYRVKGDEQTPLVKAYKQDVVFTYLLEKGANPDQGRSTLGKTVLDKLILKINQSRIQKGYGYSLTNFYEKFNQAHPILLLFLEKNNFAVKDHHICSSTIIKNIKRVLEKGACLNPARIYYIAESRPDLYCNCLIKVIKKYKTLAQHLSHIPRYTPKLSSADDWIGIYPLTQINPEVIKRDINTCDYKRNTPLHICINEYFNNTTLFYYKRYAQLLADIQLLIDYNPYMNAQDDMGNTPLHLALKYDMGELKLNNKRKCILGTQLIQLLIKNKANFNVKNYYKNGGKTPLDFARKSPLNKIVLTIMNIKTEQADMPQGKSAYEWITDVDAIELQKRQVRN